MYAETFAPIDKRQMTFEDGLRPNLSIYIVATLF